MVVRGARGETHIGVNGCAEKAKEREGGGEGKIAQGERDSRPHLSWRMRKGRRGFNRSERNGTAWSQEK